MSTSYQNLTILFGITSTERRYKLIAKEEPEFKVIILYNNPVALNNVLFLL
jgi:hypothetical protein